MPPQSLSELLNLHPVLTIGIIALAAILAVSAGYQGHRAKRRGLQRRQSHARHRQLEKIAGKTIIDIRKRPDQAPQLLAAADPFVFEYVITLAYTQRGHQTRKLKRLTGDGGIDGMVEVDGCWHVLQAKRYSGRLGSGTVRTFIDATRRWRMPGILITSGEYTGPARALGGRTPRVTLIDGRGLIRMIRFPN